MRAIALMFSLMIAPSAFAQLPDSTAEQSSNQPHQQAGDEIVVTGSRDSKEPARTFVEAITVETDNQIAKFADDVCPASFGLPPSYNEAIVQRVRGIARREGIPLASLDCRPNILIIIADSSDDMVEALHKQRPKLFNGLELADIRRLIETSDLVRTWQFVETRGADGRPMQWIEFQGRVVPQLTGVMPSRIQESTRQDLTLSFIIFDLEAVEGVTLAQIADYAAMRAFARTEAISNAPGISILSLFDDISNNVVPVDSMTIFDVAYLRALYSTNNTVSASLQQANIARIVKEEAEKMEDTKIFQR